MSPGVYISLVPGMSIPADNTRIKDTKVKIVRNVQDTYKSSEHWTTRTSENQEMINYHGVVSIPCQPVTPAVSPKYIISETSEEQY